MRNAAGVVERVPAGPELYPDDLDDHDDHAHVAWFVIVYGFSAVVACGVLGFLASALV